MAVGIAARDYSFVIVGDFNPAILHPAWFAAQGLIKQGEATEAKLEVVHKEVASWSIEWMKLFSDGDRLQLHTELDAYAMPLKDLAQGVLTLLDHTPIRAIGINFGGYYQFPDRDAYGRFGHELIPKSRWSGLSDPKTVRAVVTSSHQDGRRGATNVTLAASDRFPNCVHITSNDHTERPRELDMVGTGWAVRHIQQQWFPGKEIFESVVDKLISGY